MNGWNERLDFPMKIRPQIIFSILLVAFFALFVYEAKEWRLQARLYPWAIGIPMLVLALVQLVLDAKGIGPKKKQDDTPVDFQFTTVTDPALARRRTLNIFSWLFGYLAMVWLLGFSLAIPVMVFCYLKIQSSERWPLSIVLTAAAWLLFWGLFDRLLHLPFPTGQIFTWLGVD